jgi:hypothetical protein
VRFFIISLFVKKNSEESWLVKEHHSRGFHSDLLSTTFSLATTTNGLVAISSGVVANVAHDALGPIGPFDVAALLLAIRFFPF